MFRARLLVVFLLFSGVLAPAAFIACTSTTDSPLTAPITGVTVLAETLTAGHGCGTDPSQIFKYVAVVYGADALSAANNGIPLSGKTYNVFQAANIYDCFTDGTFTNLLASNGLFSYHVDVFAYDQTAYLAAGGAQLDALTADMTDGKANEDADIADGGSGAAGSARVAADLDVLYKTKLASYFTTCTAEELTEVQTLALCQPLAVGSPDASAPTTITLPLGSFTTADGGVDTCNADYATVRVTGTIGSSTAAPAIATTACTASPLTITVAPGTAAATWTLAVTLVKADDSVLGTTTCTAATSPNLSATATCGPVQ